jgi:hypothetical protein
MLSADRRSGETKILELLCVVYPRFLHLRHFAHLRRRAGFWRSLAGDLLRLGRQNSEFPGAS